MQALDRLDDPVFKALAERLPDGGALTVLARLFLFGDVVDASDLGTWLQPDVRDALRAVDLIRPTGSNLDATTSADISWLEGTYRFPCDRRSYHSP